MGVKLKSDYSPVLHMPVLKEVKSHHPDGIHGNDAYMQPGEWKSNVKSHRFLSFFFFICL